MKAHRLEEQWSNLDMEQINCSIACHDVITVSPVDRKESGMAGGLEVHHRSSKLVLELP